MSGNDLPGARRTGGSGWPSSVLEGTAEQLHHTDLPWVRGAWLLRPERPALVLGSAQPDSDLDRALLASRGIDVARRRSGGGAVFVSAGCIWIDVTIGRDDPLWSDDVSSSSLWLGRAWIGALAPAGMGMLRVHEGPMVRHRLDRTVCFAGLAPGEVVDSAGAKVVGISQRRGREGARFQCVVHLRWDPSEFADGFADETTSAEVSSLSVKPLLGRDGTIWPSGPDAHLAVLTRLADSLPTLA